MQNTKKNSKGGPFADIKKYPRKSRTVPKKNQKGDPLVSAGFEGYVKKVKNERREKKNSEKSQIGPKKIKGGTLQSNQDLYVTLTRKK